MEAANYSPTDPAVLTNPYPYYSALREGPGATYIEVDDLWVVSRFEEVGAALRDPATFSSKALWALFGGTVSARNGKRPNIRELAATQPRSLISLDPPDHILLRRMAAKLFTKKAIDGYASGIRAICNSLLDKIFEQGSEAEVDLVDTFHHPLPVQVIADILGIHADRRHEFKRWSNILIDRHSGRGQAPEDKVALKSMIDYFGEIIEERRHTRGSDAISQILESDETSSEPLSEWDLFNFCALLLAAGNETTTNLLGNLFDALFSNPDQMAKARRSNNRAAVVEEILRYESPVQGVVRLANAPVELGGGATIPADAMVLLLTGSANRDQTRWPDADRFDIERTPLPHLGFSTGIHHCLGAALARLETTTALDVLLSRTSVIERTKPATRATNIILRGFSDMPVRIKAA